MATLLHRGDVVIASVDVASGTWSRMRGLLGVDSFPTGCGLYIPRCRTIHSVGMRFSLDLIFVDRQLQVTRVVRHVSPGRIVSGGWCSAGVFEVATGWLCADGLVPGAELELHS